MLCISWHYLEAMQTAECGGIFELLIVKLTNDHVGMRFQFYKLKDVDQKIPRR